MKKYLVVGNPIMHSLSPELHNYWLKKHKIKAVYDKKEITEEMIKILIEEVRKRKISGINITVPFKKIVISYLDQLTHEADTTQSVNTIYLDKNKIVGHNTDIEGFEMSIKKSKYNIADKEVLILGSGGVVPSIIYALNKMKVTKITLSNRTKDKAENLKKLFENLEIINWGEKTDFDMIINATSIGLNNVDEIKIDFSSIGSNKFFYDVIYNPRKTNFLEKAKLFGNKTENGKMMFIYQAHQSFTIWHKKMAKIDDETIKLLD